MKKRKAHCLIKRVAGRYCGRAEGMDWYKAWHRLFNMKNRKEQFGNGIFLLVWQMDLSIKHMQSEMSLH